MTIYCARHFRADEWHAIQTLIDATPGLKRSPLPRTLRERLDWRKPNGELKDMTCRVALLRMQADGPIRLPPSYLTPPRRRPAFPPTAATDEQPALIVSVHALPPLRLQQVRTGSTSLRWSE